MINNITIKGIRAKLMLSLISLCLIPLIMLGGITYLQAKQSLLKKFQISGEQKNLEVNNYLEKFFSTIELTSNNINLRSIHMVDDKLKYTENYLKEIKDNNKEFINIKFGTENNEEYSYPRYKYKASSEIKSEEWYMKAKADKGKIAYIKPHEDEKSNSKVITLAKTVENEGKIVGVVAVDISVEELGLELNRNKIGNSGYVYVTDKEGKILTHPNNEIMKEEKSLELSLISENKTGLINYSFEKNKFYSFFDTNENLGWKILSTMNEEELKADIYGIKNTIFITISIVAVISMFISLWLSNGFVKGIKAIKKAFGEASKGDLTVEVNIKSKDELNELGRDFNDMIKNIGELIKRFENSLEIVVETSSDFFARAVETTKSAEQVYTAMAEVSSSSVEQSISIQKSLENISIFSRSTEEMMDKIKRLKNIASDTALLGKDGIKLVEVLTNKSQNTQNASQQVISNLLEMNRNLDKINIISETITDITEKTNLLALNANIEAARAGESGLGFSVVAIEMKKLSKQSKISAEEIKRIISEIKNISELTNNSMKYCTDTISEQNISVKKTEDIFNKVLEIINKITDITHVTTNSIVVMDSKKDDLTSQIEKIHIMAERNVSASEEVCASTSEITSSMDEVSRYAERLKIVSEDLKKEMKNFKIKIT